MTLAPKLLGRMGRKGDLAGVGVGAGCRGPGASVAPTAWLCCFFTLGASQCTVRELLGVQARLGLPPRVADSLSS